jgi:hypothetical protein
MKFKTLHTMIPVPKTFSLFSSLSHLLWCSLVEHRMHSGKPHLQVRAVRMLVTAAVNANGCLVNIYWVSLLVHRSMDSKTHLNILLLKQSTTVVALESEE